MGHHRAAVYSVYVHPKRKTKERKPLGSFDGKGTYLGDVLEDYLADFNGENHDGSKRVHCDSPVLDGEYLFVAARHGKSGEAADILDADGNREFRQRIDHEHVLPSSGLFYLPSDQTTGWWVVHINHGRSSKALLQARMMSRFKEDYGDPVGEDDRGLMLKIEPVVNKKALDAAVEQNRVEKLKLRSLKNPSDIAEIEQWVPANHAPSVALEVASTGKGALTDPIKKFLTGGSNAMDEIVEFGGLTFEEASVTIVLPNGKTRTINIQAREGGHAVSQDMDNLQEVDGDPTLESLRAELKRSLEIILGQQ
jgi:hypothetical protein